MYQVIAAIFVSLTLGLTATVFADNTEIQTFENALAPAFQLEGKEPQQFNILDRMKKFNVPGVSVALIDKGEIAWVKAWGVQDKTTGILVTPDTLFQAASISKPIAAFTAMRMVEKGQLELQSPINTFLKSWKIPENTVTKQQPVTLEQLMSHTAGTTVHGFPGYVPGAPYPTTAQILKGEKPANTNAIHVDKVPGTSWRYSGGGYTVMQLAMEDTTGKSFPELAAKLSLAPLNMSNSSYQHPLPKEKWGGAATGYRRNGQSVEGRFHIYPENAAASLWTTPKDLATFALAVMDAWHGGPEALLPQRLAKDFLSPRHNKYGLGFRLQMKEEEVIGFQHGGSNEGFRAFFIALLDGRGAFVMTNSDGGNALIEEILTAIANQYDWSIFGSETKVWRAVTFDEHQLLAGTYAWRTPKNEMTFTVVSEKDHFLISNSDHLQPTPFYIEKSENGVIYLFSQLGMTLSFIFGENKTPVMDVWGEQAFKQ